MAEGPRQEPRLVAHNLAGIGLEDIGLGDIGLEDIGLEDIVPAAVGIARVVADIARVVADIVRVVADIVRVVADIVRAVVDIVRVVADIVRVVADIAPVGIALVQVVADPRLVEGTAAADSRAVRLLVAPELAAWACLVARSAAVPT